MDNFFHGLVRRGGFKFFVKVLVFFCLGAMAAVLTELLGYLVGGTLGLILNHGTFVAALALTCVCDHYITKDREYVEEVARSYGLEERR